MYLAWLLRLVDVSAEWIYSRDYLVRSILLQDLVSPLFVQEKEKETSMVPSRLLEPTPRSESSIMSSIPSSQWSERKHELYDTLNPEEQDLFDELQDEIEELRKLLGTRDKKQAAKKVFKILKIVILMYLFNGYRCHLRTIISVH